MWRYVRGMKIRRYVSLYIAGYSRDILIHWTFLGVHVLVLRTGIRIVKLGGASERASEHEVSTADAREPPGLAGWRPLRTRTLNLAAYGAPSFVLAAVLILFRLFFGRLETFSLPSFLSFFVQNPKFVTRYVREERNSKLNFKFSRMNIPKTLSENSKIVRYRAHECVRTRVSKNIVLHLINIRSNFELRSWFCKKANLLSNFTEITTLNELTSPPRLISIPAIFTIAL